MSDVLQFIRAYLRDGGQASERDMLAMAADEIERLEASARSAWNAAVERNERIERLERELANAKQQAKDDRDIAADALTELERCRDEVKHLQGVLLTVATSPAGQWPSVQILALHTARSSTQSPARESTPDPRPPSAPSPAA